jgi:hypothetical protein
MSMLEGKIGEILREVGQLTPHELEQFVNQVIALQAQSKAFSLPKAEADLLLKINNAIPTQLQNRYRELISKRKMETLSPEEYTELLDLTDQIEILEAERVKHLVELAQLRNTTLDVVMQQLGIRPRDYAFSSNFSKGGIEIVPFNNI